MRAIILAAGEGRRLRPHTLDRPKCMVELAGRALILRQLDVLDRCGVDEITIVTGYRADKIESLCIRRHGPGRNTRHNADYATTNMVTTLMCARDRLDGGDDVVILYADIVYEPRVFEALRDCPAPLATTVDRRWRQLWSLRCDDPLDDAETLKLDDAGNIIELGKKADSYDDIEGQYMGLIKVRADFASQLLALYDGLDPVATYDGKDLPNMYMTSFLQHAIDSGHPLTAVVVEGGWFEVDTVEDLATYEGMQQVERDRLCVL